MKKKPKCKHKNKEHNYRMDNTIEIRCSTCREYLGKIAE